MRTEDRALFDVWIEAWSDLGHFEIIPVRTSANVAMDDIRHWSLD
jgi:hypothetical protein